MSALTVADHKGSKKPQYKDYVSFLGTYKNGQSRKDDQCSVATNDSGVSFSLNNSSNNSSSSINSDLTDMPRNGFKEYLEQYNSKKYSPVQPGFIKKQKNEEAKTIKTEVYIEINNTHNTSSQVTKVVQINPTSNVSKVSKIFENNEPSVVKACQPTGKVNTFTFEQKEPEVQSAKEQKKTIGEISKKFQTNGTTTHKIPLKKTPSISEKTKLFEHLKLQQKEDSTGLKASTTTCPKPPINNNKPVLAPKISIPQHKPQPIPSPPPPPPIQTPSQNIPSPPPPPPSNAPPPPPPPPANFTPKTYSNSQKVNGSIQNGKKTDVVDGVPVIDKNDPRVKKMVYGALRGMYGAYHDKANDYIATLPRNRVKKNNGLDSIIDSIASQGGLEKLNGRANPTVENE